MTATLAIITDAYRESNITPVGAVLNANMETEGFNRLKSLIASVMGQDVGHPLVDWPVGQEDYHLTYGWGQTSWVYPRVNSRLVLGLGTAETVYLPRDPTDGARIAVVDRKGNLATFNLTLDGNGRTIENTQNVVLATDSLEREWFYRADQADWVRVTEIPDTATDFPFPAKFDDYFIIKLAMRLNPRYGRAITKETLERLGEVTTQIIAQYRQKGSIHVDPGALQMNKTTYGAPVDPYNPPFGT